MNGTEFPYSFDLFFDIKSREDLVTKYASLKAELATMDSIMESHGMEFTDEELAIINPEPEVQASFQLPKP